MTPHKDEGDLPEQKVIDLTWDGRGVVRLPNKRVSMIPGVLPGDTVKLHFPQEIPRKGAIPAELLEILNPSPDRREHPCRHYNDGCPGCVLGALEAKAELTWKEKHVRETIKRIGGIKEPEVNSMIESPGQFGYRDRLELHAGDFDGWNLYYLDHNKKPIFIKSCLLATQAVQRKLELLASNLSILDKDREHAGNAIRLLLRDNGKNGVVGIVYIIGKELSKNLTSLTEWLNAAQLHGWQIRHSKSAHERFSDSEVVEETGNCSFIRQVGQYQVTCEPDVFCQSNLEGANLLVNYVVSLVKDFTSIADFYGGYGPFAISHLDDAKSSLVYESSVNALMAGTILTQKENLSVKYIQSDLNRYYRWMDKRVKVDAMIVDPPRSGLSRIMVKFLNSKGADTLVYVSCHVAALARDLKALTAYKAESFQPVDMFPNTTDVETVALLKRF